MASSDQSPFSSTKLGPDTNKGAEPTSLMTVGSDATSGHGTGAEARAGDKDDSNATLPGSKVGPQNEDLDGEQMRAPGEGEVMQAQFDKKDAGWGEQDSLTGDLEGKKAEQAAKREQIKEARAGGADVDGGAGGRLQNEGLADH